MWSLGTPPFANGSAGSCQAIDVGKPSEVLIEALRRPVEEQGYGDWDAPAMAEVTRSNEMLWNYG